MFEELDSMKVSELKKICQKESISRYSKLKKQDLIIHIKKFRLKKMVHDNINLLKEHFNDNI